MGRIGLGLNGRQGLRIALACGAALLLVQGNPLLVSHGPPMLARDARGASIILVMGSYWLVLAAMAFALGAVAMRLTGARKAAAVAACLATAGLLVFWATSGLFGLVHLACYSVGLCRWSSLPESIMYTLAVSSSPPAIAACIVLPLLAWLTLRTRGRPVRE